MPFVKILSPALNYSPWTPIRAFTVIIEGEKEEQHRKWNDGEGKICNRHVQQKDVDRTSHVFLSQNQNNEYGSDKNDYDKGQINFPVA